MTVAKIHTDIIAQGWVGQMPDAIKPYLYLMRLDRPIGTWLLLLPAWWSILLAGGLGEWRTLILFSIGALIMRGAGCVVNDLWDRDLDGSVERTATRPIPNGDVTVKQAFTFLAFLLTLGLTVLLQFNFLTVVFGIMSILFVAIYPYMKRITWWPQAFLGLTFNFGALMGWTAVMGELSWQPVLLYIAGFFWTLGYDTIYAFQDRNDDMIVGIKSSARWLTEKWKLDIKKPLYLFYFIHFFIFLCVLLSWQNYMVWLATIPFAHLMWQVTTLDINDPKNSLQRFQSNRYYGWLMCAVIIIMQATS